MRIWHVKKGSEAKVRRGYPWLFSNELAHSPKETLPGEPIELRDHGDAVLAWGYGHPHSLISFRALSWPAQGPRQLDVGLLRERLGRAWQLRRDLGWAGASHRLCFAEADGLPGLVVDRYRLAPMSEEAAAPAQVLVIQPTTAAMELSLPAVAEALRQCVDEQAGAEDSWERTGLIVDGSAPVRTLDELPVAPKRWLKPLPDWGAGDQGTARILVRAGELERPLSLQVDLLAGQKTGFFLDQAANVALAQSLLQGWQRGRPAQSGATLRVLDLFCYVGQWSAALAAVAQSAGAAVHVRAVDASARALELAQANLAALGVQVTTERRDLIESMEGLEPGAYDVVVCDPPALLRRRKEAPKALRAYQKLNREALRRLAPGGIIVTCSCSGALPEDDFGEMLGRAAHQAGRTVHWVLRGGQAPDHPWRAEFPEGRYLKCWIGVTERT